MVVSPDDIADCVLRTFDSLPNKRKPLVQSNEKREWVPLSGIVMSRDDEPLRCASLGTGMKCLPRTKIPLAKGIVLHDWHAEILAIRAFNRFLLEECFHLAKSDRTTSSILRRRAKEELSDTECQPFVVDPDVQIHMYCSEVPCGDASMELTMKAQEDATPWEIPELGQESVAVDTAESELRGRGYFSELGIVRRKPARPDAPESWSKSCSDKIALKQFTSLLNSSTSMLISPRNAYIHDLIMPASQQNTIGFERAFSATGRLAGAIPFVGSFTEAGYAFRPFMIHTTTREFMWSRRSNTNGETLTPSNVSAVYTPHAHETLIGGTLQGRKQFDPRGASMLCRKSMWKVAMNLATLLALPHLAELAKTSQKRTYEEFKRDGIFEVRRNVKHAVTQSALKGWKANSGDEVFELDP